MTELNKAPLAPPNPVQYGPVKSVEEIPNIGGGFNVPDEDSESGNLNQEATPPQAPAEQLSAEPPQPPENWQEMLANADQRVKDSQEKMHGATQEASSTKKLLNEVVQMMQTQRIPSAEAVPPPVPKMVLPDPSFDPEGYANAVASQAEQRVVAKERVLVQERMRQEFYSKHPDWTEKTPLLSVAENLMAANPYEAMYQLAEHLEVAKGKEQAKADFPEMEKDFRTAIAQQEAAKTQQTLPKASAPTKSPTFDFEKATAEEGWEYMRSHPDLFPKRRWGQPL